MEKESGTAGKGKSLIYRWKNFSKLLGPGIVTGASDDDPSGIATYSQAGAAFGLAS
jgi:Mn2+/Fe2+ NRAMP family transporter